MGRAKKAHPRVKVSVTLPQDQVTWLNEEVEERRFSTVSHGVEVAIRELRRKVK